MCHTFLYIHTAIILFLNKNINRLSLRIVKKFLILLLTPFVDRAIIKAFQENKTSRSGAGVARRAHNPKVGGSNPSSATTKSTVHKSVPCFLLLQEIGLCFCSGGYEPEGRITCGRLRALAVRDTASKKPSAAVDDRQGGFPAADGVGHRKGMVGSSNLSSATNNANRFRYRRRKVRNHSGFGLFLYKFLQKNFVDILSQIGIWGGTELNSLCFPACYDTIKLTKRR